MITYPIMSLYISDYSKAHFANCFVVHILVDVTLLLSERRMALDCDIFSRSNSRINSRTDYRQQQQHENINEIDSSREAKRSVALLLH